MATRDLSDFKPIGLDKTPVQMILNTSAIEFAARRVSMPTGALYVPTNGSVDSDVIPPGTFYPEDITGTDQVLLSVTKFGQAVPVTDEDLADTSSYISAQSTFGDAWASSHAVELDVSCIGVTAGPGVKETTVPFSSIYYTVNTTAGSYTAGDNHTALATAGLTEDALIDWMTLYEEGDGYDVGGTIIIAHPRFKTVLRKVENTVTGQKVFGSANTDLTGTGPFANVSRHSPYLLDYPVLWTRGAITAANNDGPRGAVSLGAVGTPGNPLAIVVNRNNLILGVPTGVAGPEFKEERIPGKDVVEFMFRARRAFALASPLSASVLELTS